MPAELIPSPERGEPHLLRLPPWTEAGDPLAEVRNALLLAPGLKGPISLFCGHWPLKLADWQRLRDLFETAALPLHTVCCLEDGARVAAASLGLSMVPPAWSMEAGLGGEVADQHGTALPPKLSIHQGTLRSGDHRHGEGALLVLGDVNPGAQVSAEGHVLVWGRLRGIAHAGRSGDRTARIVALHLHPLQLRIADQVARGPAEAPPPGLAEKAHLVSGRIQIDPAEPFWPLEDVPASFPGQSGAVHGTGLA
jgi:septum site-determining protein MinC